MVHPIYASPTLLLECILYMRGVRFDSYQRYLAVPLFLLWHHNAASSYGMPRIRQVTAGANHISRFKTPLSYLSTFLCARNISALLVDALRTLPLNYYNLKVIPVIFRCQCVPGDTT